MIYHTKCTTLNETHHNRPVPEKGGFAPKVPKITDFKCKNQTLGAEEIVLYSIS